jgi:hypothetical protein
MDTMVQAKPSEAAAMAQVSARLRERFPDVAAQEIDRLVAGVLHEFDGRPVRDFVRILVERARSSTVS